MGLAPNLYLELFEEGKPAPVRREVPEEVRRRVWSHFEPYFEELSREVAEGGEPSPSATTAPVEPADGSANATSQAKMELVQIVSIDAREVVVRRENGEKWVLEIVTSCSALPPIGGRARFSFGGGESLMRFVVPRGEGECKLRTVSLRD